MNVITLGGNAILAPGTRGTIEEQVSVVSATMAAVADIIAAGERVVISHGNGPIVGNILERCEAARDRIPPMPLDVCGADSQGGIGYMLQQVLDNELRQRGIERTVVTLVTRCVVDLQEVAEAEPTKPIGPHYAEEDAADLTRRKGWQFRQGVGGSFRRVVASPHPRQILEWEAMRALIDEDMVVIAAGGGGIPVALGSDGRYHGVEVVIDKDRAAAVLAHQLDARRLVILTNVPRVALDFGKPTQREVERLTMSEARAHLAAGQFPAGSMGPKVEACVSFVEGGGEEAIIALPDRLAAALQQQAGTRIVADESASP